MRVTLIQHPSITLDLAHTGGLEVVELNELSNLKQRGVVASLYVAKLVGRAEDVHASWDAGWRNRYLQSLYYCNIGRKTHGTDVYHGHYTPFLPLEYPQRSLVHYHGLALSELPLYRYHTCRQRYHAAHYVFCAAWLVDGFRQLYPQMPLEHLHVVLNGVDHNAFRPGPRSVRDRIPRIVFYAGWIPSKGIYELLEAVSLLEQKRTDFEVYFGGSAFSHYKRAESPEIDRRVRELASNLKTVKLIGHVDHSALPELLRAMDIGCVPSVYEDPFPLVPLEMMAAGLPVVAFGVGGLRESVVDGITGFLVENKNVHALAKALETLIDNEQLRLEMGAKARKRVEQYFTWDRHVDQLLEIYEQIIKRNRDRKR